MFYKYLLQQEYLRYIPILSLTLNHGCVIDRFCMKSEKSDLKSPQTSLIDRKADGGITETVLLAHKL